MEQTGEKKVQAELLSLKKRISKLEGLVETHREKEKTLREEADYLRYIIENIQETVVIADKDMVIEYMSPSCMFIAGHSLETQKGKTILDLVHPDDFNCVLEAAQNAILTRTGRKLEYRYKHADGHYMWFETSGNILYDADGEIKGAIFIGRDITQRKKMEEALRESEETYRVIFENTGTAIIIVDEESSTILLANNEFEKLTGHTKDEIEGKKCLMDFIAEVDLERAVECDLKWRSTYDTTPRNYEIRVVDKAGNKKDIYATISSIPRTKRKIASVLDITELKRVQDQLLHLSLRDVLTGLYNRNFFEEESNRFLDGREKPLGLILCDVDGLKLINDTLGHREGDNLLKAAAEVLKKCFRVGDIIARVGGDEFAVLLPKSSKGKLEESCRRVRETVSAYNKGRQVPLSMSIGTAIADDRSLSIDNLFKEADKSMYREKLHRSEGVRTVILDTLAKVLKGRGVIAQGQVERLQDLSCSLSKAGGLSERSIDEVSLLAQYQDIGMIGIPENIINKQGPLNQEERLEMQRHCEIGHRIALSAPELAPIANCILMHHEWWNGEGYPLGLRGEVIPVECRVIAVLNAYYAMTNDRPYRKAMPPREAINELKRCRGTQFDPYLVDEFVKLLEIEGEDYQLR